MNNDEIFTKIQNLLAETLEVDPESITIDSTLDDLGLDSFDKLELITALESDFDVVLDDEVLERISRVSDAIQALKSVL